MSFCIGAMVTNPYLAPCAPRRSSEVVDRMVEAPDNVIFEYLRRLDTKLDRIMDDIGDLKIRMTAVEERLARTDVAIANLELSIAGTNRPIDRIEARLDRIERRLDLAELPH